MPFPGPVCPPSPHESAVIPCSSPMPPLTPMQPAYWPGNLTTQPPPIEPSPRNLGPRPITAHHSTHYPAPPIPPRPPRPEAPPPYRRRILFYDKRDPHYGFTNFSPHPVVYEGRKYPTSEHLFQALKFFHRPDLALADHIRTFSSRPSVAFSEARRFAPEVRHDWLKVNVAVMDEVIWHKFDQHPSLKKELLETGDAELVEDSDKDAFWGIGADGKGMNKLGLALQKLREELRTPTRYALNV